MDLSVYYEEICKQPLLSKEEEDRLITIIFGEEYSESQKKKARDTLISANLRFVFKKAKVFAKGDSMQFEDLISAGNEGLIVGLDKFNPGKGVRFLSYAGWWVIQRQLKEMSKMRLVPLPIWKQQLSQRIMKVQEASDHPLTPDELQEHFPDVKRKDLEELSQTRYLTFYFEDLLANKDEDDDSQYSVDAKGDSEESEDLIDDVFHKDDVYKLLVYLTPDQATVLRLSYGLQDGKERSSTFIADYLEVSREEVRKIKKEAIATLYNVAVDQGPV